MRTGHVTTTKTFPMKDGDKLIFWDRFGRVTSIHRVTYVDDASSKKETFAVTEVRDVR